jgi:hypothetical protein
MEIGLNTTGNERKRLVRIMERVLDKHDGLEQMDVSVLKLLYDRRVPT